MSLQNLGYMVVLRRRLYFFFALTSLTWPQLRQCTFDAMGSPTTTALVTSDTTGLRVSVSMAVNLISLSSALCCNCLMRTAGGTVSSDTTGLRVSVSMAVNL